MKNNTFSDDGIDLTESSYRAGDTGVGRRHFPVKRRDAPPKEPTQHDTSAPFMTVSPKKEISHSDTADDIDRKDSSLPSETIVKSIEPTYRAGDTGIGRRHFSVKVRDGNDLTPLPEDNSESCDSCEDYSFNEESILFENIIPKWFRKCLWYILILIAAIAVFIITVETASFLENLRHLSRAKQILLSFPMICVGIAIIWVTIRIFLLLLSLKKSPQIRKKALQELENRRNLRKATSNSGNAFSNASDVLCLFLKDSLVIQRKKLLSFGVDSQTIDSLEDNRSCLVDEIEKYSSRDWIDRFQKMIESPLDDIAKKRIRYYSVRAGILSGLSPFPLMDRMIVLFASFSMIKDLMEIYGLHPSWNNNLTLASFTAFNTYFAGILQGASEAGTDWLADNLAVIPSEEVSSNVLGGIALKTGKIVGTKAAESFTQGLIVYRLGKATMKTLQPLSS